MIPFISSVTFWEVDQYVTKEWCSNLQLQAQPKIRCPAHQTSATLLAFSRYSWHPQISTTWRADSHSGWLWSPTNNRIKHCHTTMTKNHQGFWVWGKNKFENQSAATIHFLHIEAWIMGPAPSFFWVIPAHSTGWCASSDGREFTAMIWIRAHHLCWNQVHLRFFTDFAGELRSPHVSMKAIPPWFKQRWSIHWENSLWYDTPKIS